MIRCSICQDKHQNAILQKEKQKKPKGGESGNTKCTSLCGASEGSISCSKVVLVNVISKEKPQNICRVYAIIDNQSNMSLITSDLANELGATGPEEKYYLTTCSGEKTYHATEITPTIYKNQIGFHYHICITRLY